LDVEDCPGEDMRFGWRHFPSLVVFALDRVAKIIFLSVSLISKMPYLMGPAYVSNGVLQINFRYEQLC
jgi:hypothetical protein